MEQVSIVRVLNYDIMYKKQSLAVWKKSKRQMIQTVILETLSIACRPVLSNSQQTLPCIRLPQHLPSCLLLEDSGCSRHQSLPKSPQVSQNEAHCGSQEDSLQLLCLW